MFELIDSLIATITFVLLLSLIVQSIQQVMKQLLSMKSKFMERELFALFQQVPYKRRWLPNFHLFDRALKENPEVKDLIEKIRNKLSGIGYNNISLLEGMSKDDFLKLIGDLLDTGELERQEISTLTVDQKNALEKKIIFLQKARWDAEQWFDLTITSFKDQYERRMKMWAFAFGALVVVWLNANVFEIYKEFSTSKVLRDAAVKIGERLASTPKDSLIIVRAADGNESLRHVPDSLALNSIRTHITYIDSMVYAQSFQLYRWNSPGGTPLRLDGLFGTLKSVWDAIVRNLFGWLVMTLLVGLGAPFWYDILKTFVGIKDRMRGSGGEKENVNRVARTSAPPPQAGSEVPTYG